MNRIGVTQLEDAFALTLSQRERDYSDFSPCFYPAKIHCRHWIPAFAGMSGWRRTFVTHLLNQNYQDLSMFRIGEWREMVNWRPEKGVVEYP